MNITKRVILLRQSPIFWIMFAGCLLRIYSACARGVINRDGAGYIYQAQAIFSGQWSEIIACKLTYISIYPFFIAGAYPLFNDWIVAGVVVNVIFGSAVLIPLYLLLKRFADHTVCILTLLIYALMPTFINGSGDIIRGPVFWFFLTMGMLMFIRQWDDSAMDGRYRLDLALSCLFFLLAAWARVEGVAFIGATVVYQLMVRSDRKMERMLCFLVLPAMAGLLAAGAAFVQDMDVSQIFRADRVYRAVTQLASNYADLDGQLKTVYTQHGGLFSEFVHRLREALWILPFAVIFHHILDVFFYPYALIYLIGFSRLRQYLKSAERSGYLFWLSITAVMVLYVQLVHKGVMIHRFFAILLYPSCIVFANGIGNALGWLKGKIRLEQKRAVLVVVVFFLVTGLPKVVKPKEPEGHIIRQAAQAIAAQKENDHWVRIAAAKKSTAYGYVFLYAHRKYPSALCGRRLIFETRSYNDYFQMVEAMDAAGVDYLLYEDRHWHKRKLDLLGSPHDEDFDVLGRWRFSGSNEMILFKRKPE